MVQTVHNECRERTPEEQYALLEQVIGDYAADEKNLIQILHMAQAIFGYLPLPVQRFVAEKMDIPLSRVSGVVTFYSFFSTQPKGRHTIQICLGTACYVRGGKKIVEKLTQTLGVGVGETTKDGRFSLQVMRCIGACGLAPAISINGKVFKRVNPNRIQEILDEFE
ncbi:MAG: NAD(P)H-dependent oxidoreductase subunit E [Clostridiales bacterium]|nr:NAD(P)H-dependent oxidoreductase subunit E [Clostridiales bacterium]